MNRTRSRLRILHTNDIHSRFEQMPAIAAMLKALREEAGDEHTLTLDIGDHMDRVRPETEGTEGAANIAVLQATGYDAVTLGNNEGLTFNARALQTLYEPSGLKVALANMTEAHTGELPSWAAPYHLFDKGGVTVGVIGVTACFPDFYSLLGWRVQEPLDRVRYWVEALRAKVDVLIVMSHLGIRLDERMAGEIAGIDVILGGHTHHLLEEPLRIGDTLVCAAGKFGQYVGVVELELETAPAQPFGRRSIVRADGRVLPVTAEPGDPAVAALIRGSREEGQRTLAREVAMLSAPLAADWYRESPLCNLLTAGLRAWTGAEVGLMNAGQLLDGLPAGAVSAASLLALCPSPINPTRLRLTGEQLLRALEESLLPEFMEKPIFGFGFRGKVLGTLCVDGLTVRYDPEGPAYAKIRRVLVGDGELEPQRTYTVGTLDMFTFGIGYLSIAEGTDIEYFLPEFLRDVLRVQLNDPGAIHDSFRSRWIAETPEP